MRSNDGPMGGILRNELGIAVTTFNRREKLSHCLDKILLHTRVPYTLIVADDGSSDDTCEMLRARRISFVTGPNRGIAWNKNRGLFYLSQIEACATVVLIEDDCYPSVDGWEEPWIAGAEAWGHVNLATHAVMPMIAGGKGTPREPYRSGAVSGQCASFSADVMTYVGYIDTRFRRYGHEHVEHSLRCLRLGYGGEFEEGGARAIFYLIDSGIVVTAEESYHSPEAVAENGMIFQQIQNESIHRWAWRDDEQLQQLRREMASSYDALAGY